MPPISLRSWPLGDGVSSYWHMSVLCCTQAFACFASALNLAPDHAETLIACGTLYKNCGLLVEAVESYKLALKGTPDDMALREALAVALTDLGERRESGVTSLCTSPLGDVRLSHTGQSGGHQGFVRTFRAVLIGVVPAETAA